MCFYYHGYNDIWLNGRWIKVTPTFNLSLCEKFRVKPLDWDGMSDAVFHPFDMEGRRHMEYVNDRGSYADLPYEDLMNAFVAFYGDKTKEYVESTEKAKSFDEEAEEEARQASAN